MLFAKQSKRQFLLQYGMNSRTFDVLVSSGVIKVAVRTGKRSSINVLSHDMLEGSHYIKCLSCGAYLSLISSKHLLACSGLTLKEYDALHLGVVHLPSLGAQRRVKTEAQKARQSEALKTRFQGPQGSTTRLQISEASKRLQASEYGVRAASHLRSLNSSVEQRAKTSLTSRKRWSDPLFRAERARWQKEHRDQVLVGAAFARRHNTTTSKVHLRFKEALQKAGIGVYFQTEFPLGPYLIDEAAPSLHLALEVDGCYWHGCTTCGLVARPEMTHLDKRKSIFLLHKGWHLLRFKECDINSDLESCVERVLQEVVSHVGLKHQGSD